MSAIASLAITSAGLLTSVGHDARTACAAIRAGVSRPTTLEEATVIDLEEACTMPLAGHAITPLTNGFVSVARWLQMAPLAFANLVEVGSLPAADDHAFWGRCIMLVVVPDLLGTDRFLYDPRATPEEIPKTFLQPLLRQLPPALPRNNIRLEALGRMGLLRILASSQTLLEAAGAERIVVLAVDSLVDPFALHWLGQQGRLKSDLNPVGLVPGECAAALLLEADRRGVHDARPAWATLVGATVGREELPKDEAEGSPRGRALARVLVPMLSSDTVDLYIDLNGENWRAKEYGTALVHLGPRPLIPSYAAVEIGDVGAASSVLNTVLAARSLQRGYARGSQVAVAVSTAKGEVGALALRRE